MKNQTFHDLLWALIKPDIEEEKAKDNPQAFFEGFFESPGHTYIDIILDEQKKEARYSSDAEKLLKATQTDEYVEAFKKNKSFYDKIYYFNLQPTSLTKNPIGYRQHRFQVSGHAIEGFINSLADYIVPRVTFHSSPKKEFTRLFELFENDFLSDEGLLEYYVYLENYYSNADYHLGIDDNTEIRGYDSFGGFSFDCFESVDGRCKFYELRNWLDQCHPKAQIPDQSFFCAIKRVRINKKIYQDIISPYEFGRKMVFSLRLIDGGSVFFQAIGIKAMYFSPPFELSEIRSFPGNEMSSTSILTTRLEQHHAETLRKFWPLMESVNYEAIHVPDLKLEMSYMRSNYFGPEGRSELNTFNDVDRVQDLFQGVESLIAAPNKIDRGDSTLASTLSDQKRTYIPRVLSKIIYPDDLSKRELLEDFIRKLWDLRNEYAHGDLVNLCHNALDKTFQRELSDNVRTLSVIFRESTKRLIVNQSFIPALPDNSGKRDRTELIDFWKDMLKLDPTCSYKIHHPG